MRSTRALVVAIVFVVSGCGGDDDATRATENTGVSSADGNTYEGELDDGSTLRIRVDVDPGDAAVEPFEAFRVLTGASPVAWIVGEITVPEGTDGTGRFVTFVEPGAEPAMDDPTDDSDGVTNAEFVCSLLDDWSERAGDPDETTDAHLELYEGPCGSQTLQVVAPAGETTTYVMAYEGELPPFERVFAGLGAELERSSS